jgi:glyoxylase I family protein
MDEKMKNPFRVAELDHVVLRCRDQPRMLAFYTDVLGLYEERRVDQIGLIQLRAGASIVDLIPAAEPRSDSGANVDHFCLGIMTSDLGATVIYLKQWGVEVLGDPAMRYGARGTGLSIYIHDPEGNVVELKQMPTGSAHR